ncbi:MAG: Rrf2 family transcriptional regulator [Candidatus Margulisiibacteriota bacterium]
MNLTKKHHYGLAAMIELGWFYEKGPIHLRFIAEQARIPHAFLEQLILDLKKSGLVKSTRGAKGGYQLNLSPHGVSINQIFSAIDPLGFEIDEDHPLSFFWTDFNQHVYDFLSLSLQTLMEDSKQRAKVLTYTI